MNPNISLDPKIAQRVFPTAAREWYSDLRTYAESLEGDSDRNWIEEFFLNEEPEIITEYGHQRIGHLSWEDSTDFSNNGFVKAFSISRNHGGTLYFNDNESVSREFIGLDGNDELIKFPRDKLIEFGERYSSGGLDGVFIKVYQKHNIDHYPSALFLRNWAILYLNEALKQIFPAQP